MTLFLLELQGTNNESQLSASLLLSGFTGATEEREPAPIPVLSTWRAVPSGQNAVAEEHKGAVRHHLIKASKPTWSSGASFKLNFAPLTAPITTATINTIAEDAKKEEASKTAVTAWKLDEEDDGELVDEDELTEEDLLPAAAPSERSAPAGSAVAPEQAAKTEKKACKNCSCGRAEGAVKLPLSEEQINNPQSACGSCGLGDAFRCAGCPYLGLPPFKPGEKISMSANLLVADV